MHQREKFEFPLRLKFTDRIKGTFEGHTCSKTVVKEETRERLDERFKLGPIFTDCIIRWIGGYRISINRSAGH